MQIPHVNHEQSVLSIVIAVFFIIFAISWICAHKLKKQLKNDEIINKKSSKIEDKIKTHNLYIKYLIARCIFWIILIIIIILIIVIATTIDWNQKGVS